MKKSLFLALLIICSSLVIAVGPSDFPTGLVSHWKLDGTSDPVVDSADDNNGTGLGGVTRGVAGQDGTAFDFDGVDDSVVINKNISLDSLTLAAWVNIDSFGTDHQEIIGDIDTLWDIRIRGFGGDLKKADLYCWPDNLIGTTELQTDTWYYIVGTCNFSNGGEMNLYVNGLLENNKTKTQEMHISGKTDRTVYMGKSPAHSPQWFLNGTLDDVAIWGRALNSSEVQQLYNSYSEGSSWISEMSSISALVVVALLAGVVLLRKR